MSSTRQVLIAFPGGSAPKSIDSDATTWGQLKEQIRDAFGETFENQKVRDYTTNHHYADNDAVLPMEDLKLLVSTDKNKSGMPINKGNYHKAGFSELRTFCKKMTGFAPNGKQACLDALDNYYGKTSAPAEVAPKKAKKNSEKLAESTEKTIKKAQKPSSDVEARLAALEERVAALEAIESDGFLQAAKQLS